MSVEIREAELDKTRCDICNYVGELNFEIVCHTGVILTLTSCPKCLIELRDRINDEIIRINKSSESIEVLYDELTPTDFNDLDYKCLWPTY